MSPADIGAQCLGVSGSDIVSVERIKHGLTNESWLVRAQAGAVVVRISQANTRALQIDRSSEARILAAVATAGIAPEVLLCDPDRHLLVTRYIGATWSEPDALAAHNIVRLAHLLRRLHALTPPSGAHRIDLSEAVDGYLLELASGQAASTGPLAALRKQAHEAAAALSSGSDCLCHNDIHALNVVDDGQLRLIDWEYAGISEPLFDLASVCVYHRYSKQQREQLLTAYETTQAGLSWRRLELACWLFEYIRELWTAVRSMPES